MFWRGSGVWGLDCKAQGLGFRGTGSEFTIYLEPSCWPKECNANKRDFRTFRRNRHVAIVRLATKGPRVTEPGAR